MPYLSRLFIRSSLIYLAIGFTLGGLILSAKAGVIGPDVWGWLPAHIVILLFGWMIQLSLGVSYWILPRLVAGGRGRTPWAWASFVACQLGLILVLGSTLSAWWSVFQFLFVPGLLLSGLSVFLFVAHAAPRIRPAVVAKR